MKRNWRIEEAFGEASQADGKITHLVRPWFTAQWSTGADELADIDGPCWTDKGAGETDQILLHGFEWTDPAPGQREFERLMREAATVVDVWIAWRL